MWTLGLMIFLSLCFGAAAWLFFLWSVKSGQFDDMEGPKYRMLDSEEDENRIDVEDEIEDENKVDVEDSTEDKKLK